MKKNANSRLACFFCVSLISKYSTIPRQLRHWSLVATVVSNGKISGSQRKPNRKRIIMRMLIIDTIINCSSWNGKCYCRNHISQCNNRTLSQSAIVLHAPVACAGHELCSKGGKTLESKQNKSNFIPTQRPWNMFRIPLILFPSQKANKTKISKDAKVRSLETRKQLRQNLCCLQFFIKDHN